MQLDALDTQLLAHFSQRFPKPSRLDYCDYGVDASEVKQLCEHPALYTQANLLRRFASHNRWAMFGDWRDFPAFCGDLAVHCRRQSLLLEFDLAFFFLHLSARGGFNGCDRTLLKRWVHDVLCPWEHEVERKPSFNALHALDFLVLYATLGGDLGPTLRANVQRGTPWVHSLLRLCPAGEVDEEGIRAHLVGLERGHDNQEVPLGSYVDGSAVEATIAALEGMLEVLGDLP